jgi:hypothetical protein
MCARGGAAILAVALGPLLTGCGGNTQRSGALATDSGIAAANQGGGGANGGSATAVGGSAAMAEAGSLSAGGGAAPARGCTGGYDPPQLLFDEAPLFYLGSPSVTADELQIFYSQGVSANPGVEQTVVFRTRESQTEPFGPTQLLPELAEVCPPSHEYRYPDISEDGLTLYVTCSAVRASSGPSILRVSRRQAASGSFVLDPEPLGFVLPAAGLSADELTAYTSGEMGAAQPHLFARPSKNESFGPAQPVPGFATPLHSPDISADGLTLFGSLRVEGTPDTTLRRASRTSIAQDFGPPEELDFGMPMPKTGGPNVAPNCNLYFATSVTTVQLARYRGPL